MFSDDQSFFYEDIPKEIYSNPLFDEEIFSMKIDSNHFNAESDLIESLHSHDSSIISSFSKIDSLFDEFAGELTLLKLIPSGINETDCDPEEEIRLIKRLLDIFILEEFLSNDSLSLPKNKSFHFDIPSSSRPPAKPPNGHDAFQPSTEFSMMIYERNILVLDVPFLHFYPPLTSSSMGDWVKLSDPKQALRGRHPILILSF
nr:hypothetical protein [Tanacetum cinerariifolium]